MSGYIGDISSIYCVSGNDDTIFCGEKSERRKIIDILAKGKKWPKGKKITDISISQRGSTCYSAQLQ